MVSIIVAARNEQKDLEKSVRSLLALEYTNKELIVVNDRSDDRTGVILDRLADSCPSLKVVHLTELPPGWLGKNHAHYLGAHTAKGEVVLFTDADIVWEPTVLTRAVNAFQNRGLDHLAILPRVETKNGALATVIVGFQYFFNLVTRGWKVKDPKSFAYVGIGAFNMMRRSAYEAIGTHRSIAMRPDDDMQLGRRIKTQGLRSDFLFGVRSLGVEWYESVGKLIEGLMKNSFSAANYHLSIVIAGSLFLGGIFIWPFLGVFLARGLSQTFCGLSSLLILVSVVLNARRLGLDPWRAMVFPFVMLLLLYIVWKASLRTLWRGGIEWRGTFYSLKELRRSPTDHR